MENALAITEQASVYITAGLKITSYFTSAVIYLAFTPFKHLGDFDAHGFVCRVYTNMS